MRRALFLLLCLGSVGGAGEDEERAFLETETPRTTYFVQEPVRLTLRIGVDAGFFESSAVQLFHRRLDVPVQAQAPWLEKLAGTVLRQEDDARGAGRERRSLAINEAVVEVPQAGVRLKDGRPYTLFELERTYLPLRPGELAIPAPRLRFAYATRFGQDFVNGRIPLDRHDAFADGKPLTLRIQPLPAEGKPPEFTGAVGRFTVYADAAPRNLMAGTTLKLVLRIEGEGNLELFDAPRLDPDPGDFHVYGMIDEKGPKSRTVTYDVAPLHGRVTEIPPIPFAFFDTRAPAGYRTVRTRPVPLTVRPAPGTQEGGSEPAPSRPDPNGVLVPALVATLLAAAAIGLLLRRRARGIGGRDPAREAAAVFRARLERPDSNPAALLAEYLAARLRCPTAAVITPDLGARLTAVGVPADIAARAAKLLEELVAARYGGTAPSGEQAAGALVDELEARFQARESVE